MINITKNTNSVNKTTQTIIEILNKSSDLAGFANAPGLVPGFINIWVSYIWILQINKILKRLERKEQEEQPTEEQNINIVESLTLRASIFDAVDLAMSIAFSFYIGSATPVIKSSMDLTSDIAMNYYITYNAQCEEKILEHYNQSEQHEAQNLDDTLEKKFNKKLEEAIKQRSQNGSILGVAIALFLVGITPFLVASAMKGSIALSGLRIIILVNTALSSYDTSKVLNKSFAAIDVAKELGFQNSIKHSVTNAIESYLNAGSGAQASTAILEPSAEI